MLKITIVDTPGEERWILQGRLAQPWLDELWSTWTEKLDSRQGRSCVVDLNDVTFIDQSGESVLRQMMDAGVRFVANDVCIKQVLADLGSKNEYRLRKCLKYFGPRS